MNLRSLQKAWPLQGYLKRQEDNRVLLDTRQRLRASACSMVIRLAQFFLQWTAVFTSQLSFPGWVLGNHG